MRITDRAHSAYAVPEGGWRGDSFVPIANDKFTLTLDDGNAFEAAVFTLHVRGRTEKHACISSQAGCRFACTFCESGRNGFARNLSAREISEEVRLLEEASGVVRFDELLFMGVGEPLDNFTAVTETIASLTADRGYKKHISLATVGLLPQLRKLADLRPDLHMVWLSLHAATDEKRSRIMPVNRKYRVAEALAAADSFARATGIEVWVNYMLFVGFNDQDSDASVLATLLRPYAGTLKLMLTTPNSDLPEFRAAQIGEVERFHKKLGELGFASEIRHFIASGREINAGCGEFMFMPAT